MISIRKGITAAREVRDHYLNAKSNPVEWNMSMALEAALYALEAQQRDIRDLQHQLQRFESQMR